MMYTRYRMARKREITKLELAKAVVSGQNGWIQAEWWRADGSRAKVTALFRPKRAERWQVARVLIDMPSAALLRDVPLARIEHAVNADRDMLNWAGRAVPPAAVERMEREAAQRARLARPTGRRLDD